MNKKRLFGSIFLSLMVISLFSGFVSAQEFEKNVFDPVVNLFTDWQEGELSVNVAKWLFLLLVAIVIFNVLEFIPLLGGGKGSLRWLVAFIVSFLGTAYLTPSDIYTVLAGYGAMGLVVGAIIPFIILMYFSIKLSKDGESPGGILFSKFMWIVFIVFLVWKVLDGMYLFTTPGIDPISLGEGWAYIGLIILGVIWVFFGGDKWVGKLFFRSSLETAKKSAERNIERRKAMRDLETSEAESRGL